MILTRPSRRRQRLFTLGLAFFLGMQTAAAARPATAQETAQTHRHVKTRAAPYLLLVTFATGNFNGTYNVVVPLLPQVQAVVRSPYRGVAIPLEDNRDISLPTFGQLQPQLKRLRQTAKDKDLWPWIYLNRIVNCGQFKSNPCDPQMHPEDKAYFSRINVLDIRNRAGALNDFYEEFRLAIRMARYLHSPGIVFDPEPYNNERLSVQYAGQHLGLSVSEVNTQLEAVGSKLTDLVAQEYPQAQVWFLYTGINQVNQPEKEIQLAAPIALGMLQRAAQMRLRQMKLILSGGELWGYCFSTLAILRQLGLEREQVFAPFLAEFPNLGLAGTIAPWNNPASRVGWMLRTRGDERQCGLSGALHGPDFVPLIANLLESYGNVWIYAAGAADYNQPYSASDAAIFNPILQEAVREAKEALGPKRRKRP